MITPSRRIHPSRKQAITSSACASSTRTTSLGGTIVGRQTFAKGDNDFRAQLTALKSTNPEVLFVSDYYNDVAQIAVQARDLGITQPLVGGDGRESPRLLGLGGKSLEGCFCSNH